MRFRFKEILLLLFVTGLSVYGQTKIMCYNILNYPGSDTTIRNPYFRTIIANTQPDILVVQEIQSQAGVNGFLSNVLNAASSGYSAGQFLDGPDTDNAIFYKSTLFTFLGNIPIVTELRDINEFTLQNNSSGDTIRIYSVHLKASNTTADAQQRGREVDSLRKRTNTLSPGSNFMVVGDFNMYSADEIAYQKLLNQSASGYFIDALNMPGSWNVSGYSEYHTQSPRLRAFGGGSTGGMDDRFDLILYSQGISNPGGISYISGSMTAYGNDGNHFNDSINQPPNTAVSQQVADAIHYASDHIPVFAQFNFGAPVVYSISSFTALIEGLYNGSSMISDTVTIELRNSSSPYSLVDQTKILLDQNGNGSCSFNNLANGIPYFLVVKHRSGIETWSATTKSFASNTMTYDFTTAQNKAYGSNLKLVGTKWCIYSGDLNRDGYINSTDLNDVYTSNVAGSQGYLPADVNGDLFSEIADINIIFYNNNSGITRQVPPGYSDNIK